MAFQTFVAFHTRHSILDMKCVQNRGQWTARAREDSASIVSDEKSARSIGKTVLVSSSTFANLGTRRQ